MQKIIQNAAFWDWCLTGWNHVNKCCLKYLNSQPTLLAQHIKWLDPLWLGENKDAGFVCMTIYCMWDHYPTLPDAVEETLIVGSLPHKTGFCRHHQPGHQATGHLMVQILRWQHFNCTWKSSTQYLSECFGFSTTPSSKTDHKQFMMKSCSIIKATAFVTNISLAALQKDSTLTRKIGPPKDGSARHTAKICKSQATISRPQGTVGLYNNTWIPSYGQLLFFAIWSVCLK